MSKVSFVIPLYNKESYIAQCIESLQAQTLKDIEILVVDDASTDNGIDIVRFLRRKDKRIRLVKLKVNVGRSKARNIGNKLAKSPIICVQDADDYSLPKRAEITQNRFKIGKTDVFYSGFYLSDEFGRPVQYISSEKFDIERVKKDKVTYIGHSTMAYYKNAVNKIKYSSGKYSELGIDDWKLQIDLYKKGYRFSFIDKPLMVYRQSANSISKSRNINEVDKVKDLYLKTL